MYMCSSSYLDGQINEGCGKEIRCPAYQCYKLVPEVRGVVSSEYSKFELFNFVCTNREETIHTCFFFLSDRLLPSHSPPPEIV